MTDYDYDLFVIGAGSGGTRASRVAAAHGARVAVAEEYRIGGTCVIRGCVPKKLLVYGAHFAEDLADAKRFGWQVPEHCDFSWQTLRDNVMEEVDRINGAYTNTLETNGVDIIPQRATVSGPHEVTLADGTTKTANRLEKMVEKIALAVSPPDIEVNAIAEATVVGKIANSQKPTHSCGVNSQDRGKSNKPMTTGNHR